MDLSSLSLEELNSVDVQLREARQYKIDQDRIAEKNQQIEDLQRFVRYVNEHAEKTRCSRNI